MPSHGTADSCAIKSMSTPCVPHDVLNRSLGSAQDDIESPIFPDRGTNEISVLESSSEDNHFKATEGRECVESNLQTLSETPDNQIKHLCLPDNHSDDLTKTSESIGTYNSDTSQLEGHSKKLFPNSLDVTSSKHVAVDLSVSAANGNNTEPSTVSASCESTSVDFIMDEKFAVLSLDEVVDGATEELTEDCASFLSELHAGQSPFPTDTNSSSPYQKLHSHGDEILNQNLERESILDIGNLSFSPSAWTPAEIQIATGSADCKIMEHPLKLTSAYAEVEVCFTNYGL